MSFYQPAVSRARHSSCRPGQLSPGVVISVAKSFKRFRCVFKAVLLGQLPGPFALTGALTPRITGRRNAAVFVTIRSEERRVGKEGRSRWAQYQYKKKINKEGSRKSEERREVS